MSAVALAAVCAALLLALYAQQRVFNAERQEWTKERQLLITKIQHPEYIVATPEAPTVPDSELLTAEPDEIDRVGEIMNTGSEDA